MSASRIRLLIHTRDGRPVLIREAVPADAPLLLAHALAILAEPYWNVTEPQEFTFTVAQEEAWIQDLQDRPGSLLLMADLGSASQPDIVGLLSLTGPTRVRIRHRCRLGVSVLAAHRGQGIGEALLRTALDWAAAEPEIERVDLSVFAHNQRALNLYRKLGFEEEGRSLRAFKLADGAYYDDVQMVCWVK